MIQTKSRRLFHWTVFKMGLLLFMLVSIHSTTGARDLADGRREDVVRRSNRNYSNACHLLQKKRSAKVKPAGSFKRKKIKWR